MENEVILNSSRRQLPIIGLGTYSRNVERGQVRQAVLWALEGGYRHIDTAAIYGNEKEIGEAIGEKLKNGFITRDELFITTKNDRHLEEDVVPALKESLARLNLEYVDLYLVHWPVSINEKGEDTKLDYLETWKGMEKCLELGLTKSIGVSNFNIQQIKRLIDNVKIKPDVNQFEINPTLTQHELVIFCKNHSIVPVAYTPLGLVSDARPEYFHLAEIKSDPKLASVAEKYKKSVAQVCLRYLIQRGIVVIPKSFSKARIEENFNIFDFELNSEEMSLIDSFNLDHHCVPATNYKDFYNYPF